jgi:predicted ATPase/class 3 adenylate cyclase
VLELPSGMVTFLFTDIEGSTRLWESEPEAMSYALGRHDALLHTAIAGAGGVVFKTAGDAFCAVFATPVAAIAAAVSAQRSLAGEKTGLNVPLRVRMAIHAGHAEQRAGDFFGPPLNRVARLLAAAHGGQILVSRSAGDLARAHLPGDLTLRDLGEFALRDLQQTERVLQVVTPDLRAEFPPLRAPERLLRNLPSPATPLIGRDEDVAAIRALYGLALSNQAAQGHGPEPGERQTRLLTLTGPGGTGKTRLSLHLAREIGVSFADGAAFVPLAALTEPSLVPAAVLNALDPGETSGASPREILLDYLRDRHLFLVMDNFEQIMAASTLVADLLANCPRLVILATSRERLGVRGEHEFPLSPLALPTIHPPLLSATASAGQTEFSLDDIRCAPAVRLFVERAASVKPGFAVTQENAPAIVEICTRLDGLPLAIELAAARIKLLSPQALLDRFDRRLDVLSRGHRDLPDRQRTMRDTIAWSYDLLSLEEQEVFASLAVFVGGATLAAAAEVVAGVDCERDEFAAIELLESLADKSLIRAFDGHDEPRLWMFETIRDYAWERLSERDCLHRVAERHAGVFLALAEQAEALLEGRQQTDWLTRLEREQANLRAAIGWLREHDRIEQALRLCGALWRFWWLRGDISDARSLLDSLLRRPDAIDPGVRAKALNGAGVLAECQGDLETAATYHQESLDISRAMNDLSGIGWSLNNLGVVALRQGEYDRASALLEETFAVAEQANDAARIATALIDLEQIAHYQSDPERSISLLTRGLALFRTLGDETYIARALNNLGTVTLERGDLEQAHELLTESLALHRGVGDRQGVASTLNNLAEVENGLGNAKTAMALYLESHYLALEVGNRLYAAIALENLATLTRGMGEEGKAREQFREALLLYRAAGDQQGMVTCVASLALATASDGHVEDATRVFAAASAVCDGNDQITLPDLDATVQTLRDRLGDEAFTSAWQSGLSTRINDVIDELVLQPLGRHIR